jgi:hypothetical protein
LELPARSAPENSSNEVSRTDNTATAVTGVNGENIAQPTDSQGDANKNLTKDSFVEEIDADAELRRLAEEEERIRERRAQLLNLPKPT